MKDQIIDTCTHKSSHVGSVFGKEAGRSEPWTLYGVLCPRSPESRERSQDGRTLESQPEGKPARGKAARDSGYFIAFIISVIEMVSPDLMRMKAEYLLFIYKLHLRFLSVSLSLAPCRQVNKCQCRATFFISPCVQLLCPHRVTSS